MMALWEAARDGRVGQLLDQGVPPDEFRDAYVSAAQPPGSVRAALRSCFRRTKKDAEPLFFFFSRVP